MFILCLVLLVSALAVIGVALALAELTLVYIALGLAALAAVLLAVETFRSRAQLFGKGERDERGRAGSTVGAYRTDGLGKASVPAAAPTGFAAQAQPMDTRGAPGRSGSTPAPAPETPPVRVASYPEPSYGRPPVPDTPPVRAEEQPFAGAQARERHAPVPEESRFASGAPAGPPEPDPDDATVTDLGTESASWGVPEQPERAEGQTAEQWGAAQPDSFGWFHGQPDEPEAEQDTTAVSAPGTGADADADEPTVDASAWHAEPDSEATEDLSAEWAPSAPESASDEPTADLAGDTPTLPSEPADDEPAAPEPFTYRIPVPTAAPAETVSPWEASPWPDQAAGTDDGDPTERSAEPAEDDATVEIGTEGPDEAEAQVTSWTDAPHEAHEATPEDEPGVSADTDPDPADDERTDDWSNDSEANVSESSPAFATAEPEPADAESAPVTDGEPSDTSAADGDDEDDADATVSFVPEFEPESEAGSGSEAETDTEAETGADDADTTAPVDGGSTPPSDDGETTLTFERPDFSAKPTDDR